MYPRQTKFHSILNRLKVLDIYSHANHESYEISGSKTMSVDGWIPYLTSLRVIVFPRVWGCINKLVDTLFHDPHICPALTTITSLEYPASWISLCNSLEIRNHLSMRDRSVQAIHTLNFPSSVHRNISGPLQVALSGGSPPLSSPSRFSYGRSTSSTLRASHMRDPPRLYATAANIS